MKPNRSGPAADQRALFRHRAVLPRFRVALKGIVEAYREEANLRFHLFAATCAAVAGYAVGLQGWEVAYLTITIFAVIMAELFNTAVERVVDLAAEGRRHPLAGQAKDMAAGAVLLTACHAAFAAVLLFLVNRSFLQTAEALLDLAGRAPWVLALPVAAAWFGLSGGKSDA